MGFGISDQGSAIPEAGFDGRQLADVIRRSGDTYRDHAGPSLSSGGPRTSRSASLRWRAGSGPVIYEGTFRFTS